MVTIVSTYMDPATGITVGPISAYMEVRQTYTTLSMRLLTGESSSELPAATIVRAADGVSRVCGVYRNDPRLSARSRSPMHNGAISLEVQGNPPTALAGHYWTDRNTSGEIKLTNRKKKHFGSFDAARAGYHPSG